MRLLNSVCTANFYCILQKKGAVCRPLGRGTSIEQSSGTASALKEAGELEEAQHEDTVELQLDNNQ